MRRAEETPATAAALPHGELDQLIEEARVERLRGHFAGLALTAYLVLCGVPLVVLLAALFYRG